MYWPSFVPQSVQPVEVLWFLIGVGGLLVSVPALWEFWRDHLLLKSDGINGGDMILSKMYLGVGTLMVSKHALIAVVGVIAMTINPSPGLGSRSISPTGTVITVGLMLIAMLSAATSLWLKLSRLRLLNYLRQKAGATHLSDVVAKDGKERSHAKG